MKQLLLLMLLSNISFGVCIDPSIMQTTANTAKGIYKAADEILAKIISQVKNNEDKSKQYNSDTLKYLSNVQNLDASSTIAIQEDYFNAKIISELEALQTDNQAESTNFQINKELEDLLK